jgi:CheY-like chemotaxis protein
MSAVGKALRQIVLAEDNPADVTLVRIALEDAGVNCALTVIEDGEKAMSLLGKLEADSQTPAIDLMLLDLNLPRIGGEDILRQLRSTVRNAQTPVIVMTGSDAPEDHEMTQQYTAVHYFRKPTLLSDFMQLGGIVRSVLDDNQTSAKAP